MNKTIKNKRLYGKHLNLLSEVYANEPKRLVNRELAYLLGIPSISWMKLTSVTRDGSQPLRDVQLSLLLRYVLHHPERLQRLKFPEPAALKRKVEKTMGKDFTLSDRAFSFVLARQVGCGHRWLKKGRPFEVSTVRLAMMLEHFLSTGKNYQDWMDEYIYPEAKRRGKDIEKLKSFKIDSDYASLSAIQRAIPIHKSDRLLCVSDLEQFTGRFSLQSSDIPYVVGFNQRSWGATLDQPPGSPVTDPSLAIFVRYLMANPEAIEPLRLPRHKPSDMIQAFRRYCPGVRYTDAQIIALGGMQEYALNRKDGFSSSKYHRVIAHFIDSIIHYSLDDWIDIVDEEARTRGFKNGVEGVLQEGWGQLKDMD